MKLAVKPIIRSILTFFNLERYMLCDVRLSIYMYIIHIYICIVIFIVIFILLSVLC